MRFSFQDGVVDHICSGSVEDAAVMNFKKGILSSFQNSMDDFSKTQNVTEVKSFFKKCIHYKLISRQRYGGIHEYRISNKNILNLIIMSYSSHVSNICTSQVYMILNY